MKRFIVILIAFSILYTSIFTVFASTSISFELTDCTCDINRLFSVEMVAKSDIKLSAATFEFTYDKKLFEFKNIKVKNKESEISYNELNNCVKTVFLNTFGQDIKNGDVIFTLNFKSVKAGNGQIGFTVSDCVSPDIEYIDIGNCTSGNITINDKQSNVSNSEKSSKTSTDKDKSSKKSKKQTETTSSSTYDELGILNPVDNWILKYFLSGICIGVGSVIIILILYFVPRHIIKKIKNKKQ